MLMTSFAYVFSPVLPFRSFVVCQGEYVLDELSSKSVAEIKAATSVVATADLNSILRQFGLDEIPGGENILATAAPPASSPIAAESK
jgi:hypothetical protein